MPGYSVTAPGAAFSGTIEDELQRHADMRRQAVLDQINAKREADLAKYREQEMSFKQDELQAKIDERKDASKDKKVAAHQKRVEGMLPGDVPDPEMLAKDQQYELGNFRAPVAPAPAPMPGTISGSPTGAPGAPLMEPQAPEALAAPQSAVYIGNRQDRLKAIQDQKVKVLTDQLANATPGSPEYIRAATEYGMLIGKPLTAAEMGKGGTAASDSVPVMRQNPKTGAIDRLVDGQWTPWTGDVPKGAHFMTEPAPKDTTAKDAANDRHLDQVHQQAVAELNKRVLPFEAHIQTVNDLGTMLNARTPQADSLIAPMVLKATVSGAGTGFRMTQSEINQVIGGRSKWESLQAALNKWSLDPKQALTITDEQRTELRDLAKKIREKATMLSRKATDARHSLDDATTPQEIHKIMTKLQEDLGKAEGADETDVPGTKPSMSAAELIKKYK